ncbi:hypothetical protein SK128_023884 [Halocaridina rubra]|uniref:Uncharacterized protein n=1 Tax=Halocaridina rubra TaxID=373956 RepID=A0AAN9A023_HALRR
MGSRHSRQELPFARFPGWEKSNNSSFNAWSHPPRYAPLGIKTSQGTKAAKQVMVSKGITFPASPSSLLIIRQQHATLTVLVINELAADTTSTNSSHARTNATGGSRGGQKKLRYLVMGMRSLVGGSCITIIYSHHYLDDIMDLDMHSAEEQTCTTHHPAIVHCHAKSSFSYSAGIPREPNARCWRHTIGKGHE